MEQDYQSADEFEDKPSVLKIIIDKHSAIEQTVSLIKKEVAEQVFPNVPIESVNQETEAASTSKNEPLEDKFKGLNNLLSDSRVKEMIGSVAGHDTTSIIDETLSVINSSGQLEEKRKALSIGINRLHTNLTSPQKSNIKDDPAVNLMLSLAGFRRPK